MSALVLLGLSPEPRCVDNLGISSRFQSRIATVIHITAYDLTNCTRSEPFVASLCGGLWSVLTPHLRQAPSSRYCPESAGGLLHGTRLRPVGVLTPRRHCPPRLSQGHTVASTPRNCHIATRFHQTRGPALGTAPARGPWRFSHHRTSRRQTHARFRAGKGEERGRTHGLL